MVIVSVGLVVARDCVSLHDQKPMLQTYSFPVLLPKRPCFFSTVLSAKYRSAQASWRHELMLPICVFCKPEKCFFVFSERDVTTVFPIGILLASVDSIKVQNVFPLISHVHFQRNLVLPLLQSS